MNEKQAITRVESSLQREIDKIGEELSLASRLTPRGGAHSSVIKDLTSRVSQLESRIPVTSEFMNKLETMKQDHEAAKREHEAARREHEVARREHEVTKREHEAERKDHETAMVKKDKELEGVEKLLNDCLNENDVMFEKFNEELVKMSVGLKQGKGEIEILKILKEVREEQGKLRRENMYVLQIFWVPWPTCRGDANCPG